MSQFTKGMKPAKVRVTLESVVLARVDPHLGTNESLLDRFARAAREFARNPSASRYLALQNAMLDYQQAGQTN